MVEWECTETMVPEGESSSRTTVQVAVPEWQKTEWAEHAADLEMSLSEFFRSMVQAGRNGFTEHPEPPSTPDDTLDDMEGGVLSEIEDREPVTWEELVATFTADIETQVETALEDLQATGRVRYSGPENGYVITGHR